MPQLIVPAYFHPASHPAEWAWLAGQAEQVRLVVLNLANGPGPSPDAVASARGGPAPRRRRHGGRVRGHQLRSAAALAKPWPISAATWTGTRSTGVFFDRAATGAEHLGHYADLADRARRSGALVVALNHGAHPMEAYAQHADLLGTFEGPWSAYLDLAIPRWVRSRPAAQFYHLLHSVPTASFARRALAGRPAQRGLRIHHRPRRGQPVGLPPR